MRIMTRNSKRTNQTQTLFFFIIMNKSKTYHDMEDPFEYHMWERDGDEVVCAICRASLSVEDYVDLTLE